MQSRSLGGEELGGGGSARDPLEGERLDEAPSACGENRVDFRAEPRQIPGELDGFIGCDAPGDTENDPPSLPRASGMKYTSG